MEWGGSRHRLGIKVQQQKSAAVCCKTQSPAELICNDQEAQELLRVSPVCDFLTSSSSDHHRHCINIKFLMRESDGLNQPNPRDFAHSPLTPPPWL